jgi:hypothetical protein
VLSLRERWVEGEALIRVVEVMCGVTEKAVEFRVSSCYTNIRQRVGCKGFAFAFMGNSKDDTASSSVI